MKYSTLPFADLAATYGPPATRVGLQWNAVLALDPVVEVRLHRGSVDPQWFTPWHVDAAGECDYHVPGARPLQVGEATLLAQGASPRAQHLQEMSHALATDPGIPQLTVITWALPGGNALILEGNHRIVSAHLSGRDVALLELRIQGPLDSSLLPDLIHHEKAVLEGFIPHQERSRVPSSQ